MFVLMSVVYSVCEYGLLKDFIVLNVICWLFEFYNNKLVNFISVDIRVLINWDI